MCGIVGLIGTDLTYVHKKAFRDLLVIDTIRGGDSTGIIGVDGNDVITAKKAIDGYGFTNMALFTKQMTAMSSVSALVGHNRAATKGKVTDGNAHPFKMDNTYLVHNGSLDIWKSGSNMLYNCKHTDVDSEAICFDVNKNGFKHTIEKLNGAFALVTYDSITKIISFARNKERPLWFVKQKDKDVLMYASEAYMLYLVAEKHGIKLEEDAWLLDPSLIMSFDVGNRSDIYGTMEVDKDVTLYTPPVSDPWSRTRRWNCRTRQYEDVDMYDWMEEETPEKKEETPVVTTESGATAGTGEIIPLLPSSRKKTLKEMGRKVGERLLFMPYSYVPFKNNKYGMMTGDTYLDDENNKYALGVGIMYRHTSEDFDDMRGKMLSCTAENVTYPHGREGKAMLCVKFVGSLSLEEETKYWTAYADDMYNSGDYIDDYNSGFKWGDEVAALGFVGVGGEAITSEKFKELVKNGCAMCMEAIPITGEVSQEVAWVFNEQPLCPSCADLQGRKANLNDISLEEQITGGAL